MKLFAPGTKIQWRTVDGIYHKGVVKHISNGGVHVVLEDGQPLPTQVPAGICTKCPKGKEKTGKSQ